MPDLDAATTAEGPRAFLPPGVPVSALEQLVATNRRLAGLPPPACPDSAIAATTAALERIRDIVHVTLDPQQMGRLAHVIDQAAARERQRIRQLAITEAKRQPLGGTFDSTEKVLLAFADLLDGDANA